MLSDSRCGSDIGWSCDCKKRLNRRIIGRRLRFDLSVSVIIFSKFLTPKAISFYRNTFNRTGAPTGIFSENVVITNQLRNITRIRALDLNNNGTGGFASIVSGGVGQRNVTLRLQASAIGRGYQFFVDVYGN